MNSLGIKSVDEIGPKILETKSKRQLLQNSVDYAIERNLMGNKALTKAVTIEKSYTKRIDDFKKLEREVTLFKGDIKEANLPTLKNYFRTFFFLSAAAGGAIVGSQLDFNSNQYIDIMNQEEYYRECGTQRYPKK